MPIKTKIGKQRKTDHEVNMRLCLMCKQPFESEWAGNRICKKCKSSAAFRNG